MPRTEYCPYFRKEKNGYLYCEGCRLRFLDRKMRRELVYRYCASPAGYRDCQIKTALDGVYERKSEFTERMNNYNERKETEKGNTGI